MQGQRFGPYEVTSHIGSGGMGSVYAAERADRQFAKKVAIKVLHSGGTGSRGIEKFLAEQQTLATLDHPNIVKLLDGGVTAEGQPYYIMDYVEGVPVDEYVKRVGLSRKQRLRLFLRLCDAVSYAHRNLIVHRDLKPRNILVTPNGVPKLLDFGIAKLLRPKTDPEVTVSTRAFATLTLEYASPEQIRHEPVTTAVDVYALGVLLYELLTGRWPYRIDSKNDVAIAYAICHAEPALPGVNADLDAIILRALRKKPEDRYPSVADLFDDVEHYLSDRPVLVRPQTLGYKMGKLMLRHRSAFAVGAAAMTIAVIGVVGVIRQSRVAEEQRALATARFDGLRQLLGTFLFDVHDDIRDLPGSTHARSLIVDKASSYLQWLSQQSSGDAELQLDLADAYLKLGGALGDPYEMNLGRTNEALAAIEKGRNVAQEVLARDPGNLRARRYVALAAYRRVNVLMSRNERKETLQLAQFALGEFQKLAAAQPRNVEAQLDLSLAYEAVADIESEARAYESTMRHLEDAIGVMRGILRMDKNHFRAKRALVVLRMKLADQYRNSGNAPMAQTAYQVAQEELHKLEAESPRPSLRRLNALLKSRTGHLLYELKEYPRALEMYAGQVRILEALAAADPNDQRARFDLAAALRNIAETSWFLDKNGDAIDYARRGQEILEKVAARDPGNLTALERHGQMLLETGYYLSLEKRTGEAETYSRRGLAVLAALARRPDAGPSVLHNYAEWLLTAEPPVLRNPAAALPFAEQAMARTGGADFTYVDTLSKAHAAAGNVPKAIQLVEEAISKIPANVKTHQRAVLESRLEQYRKMAPAPD